MALELGRDFPSRWLAAPDAVRQRIYDELNGICHLLEPQTVFTDWQAQENARPTLDMQAFAARPATATTPANPNQTAIAADLKKRFLREADDLIEQALDPIRMQLREWLYQQMHDVLAQHDATTAEQAATISSES
jgi:aryl carrier-like protein